MKHRMWTAALWLLVACGDGSPASSLSDIGALDGVADAVLEVSGDAGQTDVASGPADYREPGPFAVGHRTVVWEDSARSRSLTVELWYPAASADATDATDATDAIEAFEPNPPLSSVFADMLAAAPQGCVNRSTAATRGAAVAPVSSGAQWPLAVMSHCHNCTRFSTFSVAERLASHGIAVAAPDHEDNTLWDAQDGTAIELSGDFLPTRGGDLAFVLDLLLDGAETAVPEDLRGRFDGTRVGAVGHSFGSVTAGYAAQFDPRVSAVAGLAAPMENPLTAGVTMSEIAVPVLFMLMQEDNSITEFGNIVLRDNFDTANSPAWKVEVADAGHWSVSDICGLVPDFEPCCGDDERQTDGSPFTYLPIETGRRITQNTVTAFFARYLLGDVAAESLLLQPWPTQVVVDTH